MCGSTPSVPDAEPAPVAPVAPEQNEEAIAAGDDARRRRALAGGTKSTILSGSQGAAETAGGTGKTLLGQ